MTEYLNSEQSTANRANYRVNGVPGGVDPWNFVCKKFEEIENAGDRNNRRMPQHFERLIGRCESDPVEMDGEASGENREIKVDASQASQAERNSKQV